MIVETSFPNVILMRDLRCKYCKKLLLKHKESVILEIEIKCPRCEVINRVSLPTT